MDRSLGRPAAGHTGFRPRDLAGGYNYPDIDNRLTANERDTRELFLDFCHKRLRDVVPDWYERGLPEQKARATGLACTELEAVDSGLRQGVGAGLATDGGRSTRSALKRTRCLITASR